MTKQRSDQNSKGASGQDREDSNDVQSMRNAWRSFKTHELLFDDDALVELPAKISSFECLPTRIEISDHEKELIREMDESQQSKDMHSLTRAWHRRGCSPQDHRLRREGFSAVCDELLNGGYGLSANVRKFFETDNLVDRFRCGFPISAESLVKFPDTDSKFMEFLADSHGGGAWSILFSRGQQESVIYHEEGGWHDGLKPEGILLLAGSFEEFLWRAAIEISETEEASEWIIRG